MEKIRGLASLELALSTYSILFYQEIFVFRDGEVWEGESKTDCIIFYKKFWRYWKHRKFTYICRHWLNYSEIRQNQSKPIPVSLPEQDSSEDIISASSWSLSLHFPREAPFLPLTSPSVPALPKPWKALLSLLLKGQLKCLFLQEDFLGEKKWLAFL